MKGVLLLLLISSAFAEEKTAAKPAADDKDAPAEHDDSTPLQYPTSCNQFLLGTFKLDMSPVPDTTPNLVCPGVKSNCCSYAAQHQINRLWAKSSERTTIVDVYRGFMDSYKSIFTQFARVETMAQTIFDATADQLENPCNMLSKAVVDAKFSALKDDTLKAAKRAFDFLYTSRKGFYCSLCDKNAHHLYQVEGELIALSYSFCASMVAETLPYYLFKHIHFMKMSRLYGELMAKCTIDGEWRPNEYLNNVAIFLKQADYIDELTTCKNNLVKLDAYNGCEAFCERFNPTRFDTLLEGDLSKLAGYNQLLKTLADSKVGIVKVSTKDVLLNITENSKRRILSEKNSADKKMNRYGRKLAEAPAPAAPAPPANGAAPATNAPGPGAPKGDTPTAAIKETKAQMSKIEVNNFNQQHEAVLVRPVTYDFDYDLSALFKINFDYSYVQSAHNTKYDISAWRTELMRDGINFFFYGRGTDTTRETAYKVFLEADPTTAAATGGEDATGGAVEGEQAPADGEKKEGEAAAGTEAAPADGTVKP